MLSSIGSDEVTLRFLSCTTGGPHPAARHTNLRTMLPKARVRTNEELFELRVCGDIIAARYEYSDGLIFGLWVFDWRRGSLLLVCTAS
ncbi:uncharacterized protein PHACADRAFT_246556 [Phanerochaete carnosa HHB-10118-sp]|uniref:Uncharacterized protein n=1 Tax=Phanerochaete carnosa (strain HHB-10118-sp) TaxID=650164 RepID=K5VC91_PHACS|nr:uncharacterized protein PHACADRAFT_246556 [Phanerochaete carnosa HHB-10118-sp]EKM60546.1 hypothetical protein PHACADRAFT_246556 [Phanerochaete carnosa HHB-10118-sp]